MAITSFSRFFGRQLVPTRTQLTAVRQIVPVTETVAAPKPVPVKVIAPVVTVKPLPAPVVVEPIRDIRGPIPEGMVRTSDFQAAAPAPHFLSTCSTCGGETMTDSLEPAAAPAAPAPAPSPAPAAPAPAPATPSTPKRSAVGGWIALGLVLVIGGGLVLGAVTRPRTR